MEGHFLPSRRLLKGKNKKHNLLPARRPHWVTFYYTLTPEDRPPSTPPPQAQIDSLSKANTVGRAAMKLLGRGVRPF